MAAVFRRAARDGDHFRRSGGRSAAVSRPYLRLYRARADRPRAVAGRRRGGQQDDPCAAQSPSGAPRAPPAPEDAAARDVSPGRVMRAALRVLLQWRRALRADRSGDRKGPARAVSPRGGGARTPDRARFDGVEGLSRSRTAGPARRRRLEKDNDRRVDLIAGQQQPRRSLKLMDDVNGAPTPAGPELNARLEFELNLYYQMKLIRAFEDRVSRLHRQNKILGGVYSGAGQEAIVTGICSALRPGDFVAPLHRDLGVFLMMGVDPGRLMAQRMGKENGLSRGKDSFLHGGDLEHGIFGSTSMLGSSLPIAVGAALKFQIKREKHVAVAFFGEGAASRGDVHEAMNFAGVRKLPVIFVCENNRYAYSTPLEKQMAIENVADRAAAYGFRGHVVSGNDLLAVVQLSERVIERVREGGGPALIECKTYRYRGHSEHDPALYRDKDELIEWESRDPIPRYEFYLEKRGHDIRAIREQIDERTRRIVQEAVDFAENSPWPAPESAMEDLYAPSMLPSSSNGKRQ